MNVPVPDDVSINERTTADTEVCRPAEVPSVIATSWSPEAFFGMCSVNVTLCVAPGASVNVAGLTEPCGTARCDSVSNPITPL